MGYVLGVDSGGTRTRCLVADRSGQILSLGYGGPANTNFVPPKSAQAAVRRALSAALGKIEGPIEAAVVAGPHLPETTFEDVSKKTGADKVVVVDEFEAALAAGLGRAGGWGVVIMSGTGSFCKGRNAKGEEKYAGGWGPLIGDEGSGYDLAKHALAAIVRASDGRGRSTILTELIFPHLKIREIGELKRFLYRPPIRRHKLAELAKYLPQAAQAGDKVARKILSDGAMSLAELALPVLGLFGREEDFPVVLSGGVLRGQSLLAATLISEAKKARPRANIFVSCLQPAAGTIIIALNSIGALVDANVSERLRRTEV